MFRKQPNGEYAHVVPKTANKAKALKEIFYYAGNRIVFSRYIFKQKMRLPLNSKTKNEYLGRCKAEEEIFDFIKYAMLVNGVAIPDPNWIPQIHWKGYKKL